MKSQAPILRQSGSNVKAVVMQTSLYRKVYFTSPRGPY